MNNVCNRALKCFHPLLFIGLSLLFMNFRKPVAHDVLDHDHVYEQK